MSYKYIICCDFDGVIHGYQSGWKGPTHIVDPPVPGAMEWLVQMATDPRFELAVYSSRSKEPGGIEAIKYWLSGKLSGYFLLQGFPDPLKQSQTIMGLLTFPTQKPAASMTIDDRAFHFQGVFPSKEWLLDFMPWTKKRAVAGKYAFPRPPQSRIDEIREAFEDAFSEVPHYVNLDSKDAAIADLLAEIDHLKGTNFR